MINGGYVFTVHKCICTDLQWNCLIDFWQKVVYSGSHSKVHVWRASEYFSVIKEMQIQDGITYAMAVTKAYLIVGQ